jgi:hypothetical protein
MGAKINAYSILMWKPAEKWPSEDLIDDEDTKVLKCILKN